ncbi:ATP-binding protein [Streptomyces sp. NPDC090493]|uniref:ATP-binding protein n=1 Tax=Streptomyces sp. NPDC090493 TaxID=3365964 RepID=UPI003818D817
MARLGNLPVSLASFVGRRSEVAEVGRSLKTARLLTLTGVGGIGKTRLALEVAAASATEFPDGVWLVELALLRDPSSVASTAAASLQLPALGTKPAVEQLTEHLADRRALIVLDNCEHLIDACAELAKALLTAAENVRILATSRETLHMPGEFVYTVPSLPLVEAVELLRERTAAVQSGFEVTEENRAAVSRLCAELDGLPLAIELTASRLRTLTADQAADRLEDRFALLSGGSRTALPRQRTLRAAIGWSYDLCAPAEQLLWNRLSVFAGSFTLDAAEDICSDEGISRRDVLDLLDRLITQSIIFTAEAEGPPRYRLLETIRQYGRERLAESGEEERLRVRHRGFFLALAQSVANGWCGPGQVEGLTRLRAEHSNLREALDYRGDPQDRLALASALRFHWCIGGFLSEGRHWLYQALKAAPEPTRARAQALWVGAWAMLLQGDLEEADRWLEEADRLGRQLDDPMVRACVQGLRGTSAIFRGQLEEAVALLEAAATAHAALGEGTGTILVLLQLTQIRRYLGDPRPAEAARHALDLAEAHGERWGRAQALLALGHDACLRGDRDAGMALARSGLEAQQGFNDYFGTAILLEILAWAAAAHGDQQRAARLLGAVRSLCRGVGSTALSAIGPQLAEPHARCEEACVGALGHAAYELALADGGKNDTPAQAIAFALDTGPEPAVLVAAPSPLTRREREVAALVAEGMTNRQIAAALGRSPRTVDCHVENILAKLNSSRRAQIAAWWTANQIPNP